jgi:hypothetical protein
MRGRIGRSIDWFTATADRFTAWGTRLLAGNGIRIAWLVVGCLAAVPLLGFGVIQAASTVAHEERTEVTTIDLDTTDVSGVVVDSDTGGVDLVRVGGEVTASSDQGRLEGRDLTAPRTTARADQGRVSLEFAESPDMVDAEADQGSIDIVLPEDPDVFYAIDEDADQGSVNISVNTQSTSDRTIRAKADQGSITITYAP